MGPDEKADAQAAYERLERQARGAREPRTETETRALIDAFSDLAKGLTR